MKCSKCSNISETGASLKIVAGNRTKRHIANSTETTTIPTHTINLWFCNECIEKNRNEWKRLPLMAYAC